MKKTKFTTKDMGMVAFLVIFLIAVTYYLGFYKPLQTELTSLSSQSATLDTEIETAMQKAVKMKEMQAELDEILSRPKEEITEIAPYDNKDVVLNILNGILSQSLEYSLSFTDPKVQGDGTVRRDITMKFSCDSYGSAKAIIQNLTKSNWRCLVRNCAIQSDKNITYLDEHGKQVHFEFEDDSEDKNMMVYPVSVSATITFFESTKLEK